MNRYLALVQYHFTLESHSTYSIISYWKRLHGIVRDDINMDIERDENVPHPGRVELARVPKTTPDMLSGLYPVEETEQQKQSMPEAMDLPSTTLDSMNKPNSGKIMQNAIDSPAPRPSEPSIRKSKPKIPPFVPKPDKKPEEIGIVQAPPNPDVSGKSKDTGPFIPRRRPGDSRKIPPLPKLPKGTKETIVTEQPNDSTHSLPETIYFGGYIVAEKPDMEVPSSDSLSDAGDTGIIKSAHAASPRPPGRCIDGRSKSSSLVEQDDFRIGFDPAIYSLSGNHHTVYLSNIWLDDRRPLLAERIRISGYDAREGKNAKSLFRFDTDTEIYLSGSDMVFRTYPVNARSVPIICIDARVSLKNPARNGKVVMYYRHDSAIYRYDALLRRLGVTLHLRKGM
uniref:Uncharacterized protein n=1 Tax=Candidatus Kentrum sp. TUN TaxID=2126343 RepID=A0A451A6Z7_9GAMM|nr:MAG: hypothetical protein BECKTUN1418D_GA0071000_11601 [Candidatus Kentron sp. TUN]